LGRKMLAEVATIGRLATHVLGPIAGGFQQAPGARSREFAAPFLACNFVAGISRPRHALRSISSPGAAG
jgi:hypothetical protein